MSSGSTRVLNSSNPRITITKRGTDKFDWTSSKPVVAVVIKASTTASIWYYTPPATSGTGIYNATGYGTSHVSWCGDATPPPTTAAPSTTAAPVTTTPPTTVSPPTTLTTTTTRPTTTTNAPTTIAPTTTSTTRPPWTTTSTPVTAPPE
jgi:hypothetical protein